MLRVLKLDFRLLGLVFALAVAALVDARPAAACDSRLAGSCKDYAITHNSETGLSVGQEQATSARRGRRSFGRRSYSRRSYSRATFRTTRAERRRARAEQRDAQRQTRAAEANDTETPPAPRARPRRGVDAAGFARVPGVRQETLLFLPNVPKIGSSFVPSAPMTVDSPAAISAMPLPTTSDDTVTSTFGGVSAAANPPSSAPISASPAVNPPSARTAAASPPGANAPPAAAPMKPPTGPAPTMTAEQRAAVAQAMTGGPTPGNTGVSLGAQSADAAPAAPAAAASPPTGESSPFLRYAMLAVAGILALGTMLRLAMN